MNCATCAGDCNWQPLTEGIDNVDYLGLDIVPAIIDANRAKYAGRPSLSFAALDFVNAPLPHAADLVLCRDMVQHNTLKDGVRAYANIEASGAKYLVTTSHDVGGPNVNVNHNIKPGARCCAAAAAPCVTYVASLRRVEYLPLVSRAR